MLVKMKSMTGTMGRRITLAEGEKIESYYFIIIAQLTYENTNQNIEVNTI